MSAPATPISVPRWGGIWSPPALASIPDRPVFMLRPARPDDMAMLDAVLAAEGFPVFPAQVLRDEALKALRNMWGRRFAKGATVLRRLWKQLDSGATLKENDRRDLDQLDRDVQRAHPGLREMVEANARATRRAPDVAASLLVVGWVNLPAEHRLEHGRTPLALIDAAKAELAALERASGLVEGRAEAELVIEALFRAQHPWLGHAAILASPSASAGPTQPEPNPAGREPSGAGGNVLRPEAAMTNVEKFTPPGAFVAIAGGPALFVVALAQGQAFVPGYGGGTTTDFEEAKRMAEQLAEQHRVRVELCCHPPRAKGGAS